MKRTILTAVSFLLVIVSTSALAQKNELGFLAGATFSPDNSTSASYQGIYGRRIVNAHVASLYLELPVVGVTQRNGPSQKGNQDHFSSIFVTPSLKLKFLPNTAVAPFLSVGGGFAHFSSSFDIVSFVPPFTSQTVSNNNTTGAFQAGGGVDIKTPIPALGLRLEVREFYTGEPDPDFGLQGRHQNLFAGGGIVLRF
jgi:hypothetical protein